MNQLSILYQKISALKPHLANARTHSPKQVRQIANSIRSFGFNNPVLVNSENGIVAGHGRVEAAKLLGMVDVPTVRLDHLTDGQKRAYVIADNRLAELAGWDSDILAIELQSLLDLDLGFDLTHIGFETGEIDFMLVEHEDKPNAAGDEPLVPSGLPVSQLGDLWLMGDHRLLCGDALLPESYATLMGEGKAGLVFTDPPYNVPIQGHVCGSGKNQHREFAMASGEMSEAEFTSFLTTVFHNLVEVSRDGSIHFICMDWRHLFELLFAGRACYSEYKNLCVWAKSAAGMGSLYRSQHELVAVFKNGTAAHINNVELGRHGRNRTNVWSYDGMNGFQADREASLAMHPTVKPVTLVSDAILDCSKRKDIVLDPFAGSGTTFLAAQKVGRHCYGMELDPAYVDVAVRRISSVTGLGAIHAYTGKPFAEMEAANSCDRAA